MNVMHLKFQQLLKFCAISTCFFASLASAASRSETRHKLKHINTQINHVQLGIKQDLRRQLHWQHALRYTELTQAKLAKQLQQTRQQLNNQQNVIQDLTNKTHVYQDQLNTLKKSLSLELKTAYMLGNQPQLKLLLSQQSSDEIDRTLMYYRYMEQQRVKNIGSINAILKKSQQNLAKLQKEYNALRKTQATELDELKQLHLTAKQREQLIHLINRSIKTKSNHLHILLSNKHHMEQTLKKLSQNPQMYAAIGKHFAHLKHHLPIPTKGRVIAKFGTAIEKSQLKWKGVLIKAPINQPVYAVADGKVVFADWMPGYGLLLIIYHGQGYMTLYGRNHTLNKHVGDIVQAGDKIATVGESGGFEHPDLYFAIRHNTEALNPTHWFR